MTGLQYLRALVKLIALARVWALLFTFSSWWLIESVTVFIRHYCLLLNMVLCFSHACQARTLAQQKLCRIVQNESNLHNYFVLRDLPVFDLNLLFFNPSAANIANGFRRSCNTLRNCIFETLFRAGTDLCDSSY